MSLHLLQIGRGWALLFRPESPGTNRSCTGNLHVSMWKAHHHIYYFSRPCKHHTQVTMSTAIPYIEKVLQTQLCNISLSVSVTSAFSSKKETARKIKYRAYNFSWLPVQTVTPKKENHIIFHAPEAVYLWLHWLTEKTYTQFWCFWGILILFSSTEHAVLCFWVMWQEKSI